MLPEWLDARTLTFLAAFIALGALIQTSFSDIRQDIRAIGSEVGTMRGEVGTMRGEVGTMRGEIGTMRGEIGTMRGEIETVRGEMWTMRGEMHRMGKDLTARIDGVREQLRAEIHSLRVELRADIGKLDDRLRVVETDVAAIRAGMVGFDTRIRAVEQHARHATQGSGADTPEG